MKVLHRNLFFPNFYANNEEENDFLLRSTDHEKEDSFYSADEESDYENPVTHNQANALVKVNTLMNDHFDA